MKRFSFHSTKILALVISASGILLSASMAQAAENQENDLRSTTQALGTICQPTFSSLAQPSFSISGRLLNRDRSNTLRIVCPIYHGTRKPLFVLVHYFDRHPTKNVRCRVGARKFYGSGGGKSPYESTSTAQTPEGDGFLTFENKELSYIENPTAGVYYMYCEIPQMSENGNASGLHGITWKAYENSR